jgi:hypothetical protein
MGQIYQSQVFDSSVFLPDPARMADRVFQFSPASDAEALKLLRANFPDSPLSMRVAALDYLMRRRSVSYKPR